MKCKFLGDVMSNEMNYKGWNVVVLYTYLVQELRY
jgi:hypothetical protein